MMLVLKRTESLYSAIAQCAVIIIILLAVLPEIKEIFNQLKGIDAFGFLEYLPVKALLKAFGILSIGSIAADICRDNGESAVAGVVEMSVKILAASGALPVFFSVIKIAEQFFC